MKIQLQFLHLAIKLPLLITMAIISTIASHLISLLLSALSHLRIFKPLADPDDHPSSSANYILILDTSSPSLLPVPIHVVTATIKNRVPIIPYSDFTHRHGGIESIDNPVCTVCLESIDGSHLIRELFNCKHLFHQECLDRWVDVGQVYCPLCRSMLLPPKKLLSFMASTGGERESPAAGRF